MTEISIKPFPGYITLKQIVIEETTASGLKIPVSTNTGATAGSLMAEVIQVGEGVTSVKAGDKIATHKGKCTQFPFTSGSIFTCQEEHIIGHISIIEKPSIIQPEQKKLVK